MRRVIAIVAGTVLTGVLAGSVLAAQNQQNGYALSASGWRLTPGSVPGAELRAAAQIAAGKALGTLRFANTNGLDVSARASCGNVDGHVAVLGGRITSTTDPIYAGGNFLMWFIDDGTPAFGIIGPDSVSTIDLGGGTSVTSFGVYPDLPADFPVHCPPAVGAGFDQVVADGNIRTFLGNVSITRNQNGQ